MSAFTRTYLSLIVITLLLLVASCSETELDLHKIEPITALYYTLDPVRSNSETVTFYFEDRDGDGGRDPIILGGNLTPNTTYVGKLHVLYGSAKSISHIEHETIPQGINEQPELYQVFYSNSDGLKMEISYDDEDANGNPVGLRTILMSEARSSGSLNIKVVYNPDKFAGGAANGLDDNASGSNEIEVDFNLAIG